MKIQLLIASGDQDYVDHLCGVLADKYADVFEVRVYSSSAHLRSFQSRGYDVAIVDMSFSLEDIVLPVRLMLQLWDGNAHEFTDDEITGKVKKYQRISSLVENILEQFAGISTGAGVTSGERAQIVVSWSPAGGVGKTTVALAFATRRVADGKQTTYLDLEPFASTQVVFSHGGKSISNAFGRLDQNIEILLRGIRQEDSGSGVAYYVPPENYDDMNLLTAEDFEALIMASARGVDVLVVDLPSVCDARVKIALELADTVLLVTDAGQMAQKKLETFMNQHDVFGIIHSKTVLVTNKGSRIPDICRESFDSSISLPYVNTDDVVTLYKSLSGNAFTV